MFVLEVDRRRRIAAADEFVGVEEDEEERDASEQLQLNSLSEDDADGEADRFPRSGGLGDEGEDGTIELQQLSIMAVVLG